MLHPGQIFHEALVVIYSHEVLGVLSSCQYNHLLHLNAAGFPDTNEKGSCQQIYNNNCILKLRQGSGKDGQGVALKA